MKLRKKHSLLFFWLICFVMILAVMLFPLVLKNPTTKTSLENLVLGLEHEAYKEAYIGVWGGIIGSCLGVLGAFVFQKRSEQQAQRQVEKKFATIIYYDIKLFYEEFNFLAVAFLALKDSSGAPQSFPLSHERFMQLKKRADVLITDDWISTVAELGSTFDDAWIKNTYSFYGVLCNMRRLLNDPDRNTIADQQELREHLLKIGYLNNQQVYQCYSSATMTDPSKQIPMKEIMDSLKACINL